MKKTAFLISFLLLAVLPVVGQQIKSIVGTTTYFYTDSITKPLRIDTNIRIIYNEQGKELRHDDYEGVCHQEYEYDKQGRCVSEKNYCGEGFSECIISYEKGLQITRCETNYHTSVLLDSLDEHGRIIFSREKIAYHFGMDSGKVEIRIKSYGYDQMNNLVFLETKDSENNLISLHKYEYSPENLRKTEIHYGVDKSYSDSTLYSYDDANRLIRIRSHHNNFNSPLENTIREFQFSYATASEKKCDHPLNDTLIYEELKYLLYDFSYPTTCFLSEVSYKMIYDAGEEGKRIQIKYDQEGRITNYDVINFMGVWDHKTSNEITYTRQTEAILTAKGKNYMGNVVTGYQTVYNGPHKIKHSEYTEHGFPYRETIYQYSHY